MLRFIESDAPMTTARFRSINDADVVIFRDVDDRISQRGIQAVSEWLDSGLRYHIIKDHPQGHSALMLAGMWGARGFDYPMNDLIEGYFNKIRDLSRNADQDFLAEIVYPLIKDDILFHCEHYTPKIEGNSKMVSFSTESMYPANYIGVALFANDYFVYDSDSKANGGKPYAYDLDRK